MKKLLIVYVIIILTVSIYSYPVIAEDINISAQAGVVMEKTTGMVIYEKNARKQMTMASTTKIMTGIIAIEEGNLSDVVVTSPKAANVEGSSIWLEEGEKMKLEDLVYGLLLSSGNDAAIAIAEHVGGSVEGFAKLMNKKAQEIGAVNTSFKNPNGLDEKGHYTTAYDLALITSYALKNKNFSEIVSTQKRKVSWEGHEWDRLLKNHNKLLRMYENCDGVKTGYTRKSGRCLVSSATKNDIQIVAVTLNAPNDWEDHKKMLDLGFDSVYMQEVIDSGEYLRSIPVIEGKFKDKVPLVTTNKICVPLRNGDLANIEMKFDIPNYLTAPVKFNQDIGKVGFYLEDLFLGETNLVSNDFIEKKDFKFIFKLIIKNWLNYNNFKLILGKYIM